MNVLRRVDEIPAVMSLLAAFVAFSACGDTHTPAEPEPPDPQAPSEVVLDLNRIAVGESHACVLDAQAAAWCWGDNRDGQLGDGTLTPRATPVRAGSSSDYVAIAAGGRFTCAMTGSGQVECWGSGFTPGPDGFGEGPITVPQEVGFPDVVKQVAIGSRHACALVESAEVYCWGENALGQIDPTTVAPLVSPTKMDIPVALSFVAAGGRATCALSMDGDAWCWGEGALFGPGDSFAPTHLQPGSRFQSISVGYGGGACGLATQGLLCWGDDQVNTTPLDDPVHVSIGSEFACAIERNGTPKCWGRAPSVGTGQSLGFSNPAMPVVGGRVFSDINTGPHTACAREVETDYILCWGSNREGMLGIDAGPYRLTPEPLPGGRRFVDLHLGSGGACAIEQDSSHVYCWGGLYGEDGPVVAANQDSYTDVAVSDAHRCAVTASGAVHCWGFDGDGRLGRTSGDFSIPGPVASSEHFEEVVTGRTHTCALTVSGGLFCWGDNRGGQVGTGDVTVASYPVPVLVDSVRTYRELAAHQLRSCAVTTDGEGACWGQGDFRVPKDPFARPPRLWDALAPGVDYRCGIAPGGGAVCWGAGSTGALGLGSWADIPVPIGVVDGGDYQEVFPGPGATCAIDSDGQASCWGKNQTGQLGIGTIESANRPSPLALPGPVRTLMVSSNGANEAYGCALLVDGAVYCWGSRSRGVLGVPERRSSAVPVRVVGL